MNLFELIAMAPPPPGTEANPTGEMLKMVMFIGVMIAMFYFVLYLPQKRQRKEQENLLQNVKTGDKILTTGGLYGIVANVKDKSLMVKIAENVKVEIAKSGVASVVQKGGEAEAPKAEQK